MQVDFRNAGVGMLRERIVEVLLYPLLDPFFGIELHRSAGSVVECPHVVQSADMVLMLVGQQNSVESFHARPQHLLPEIRARVDQDRFAARLDQGRRSQPLVPLVRRQATLQWQEMTGTPCDVPVPRKVSLAMRNDSLQVPKVAKKTIAGPLGDCLSRAEEVSSEPA